MGLCHNNDRRSVTNVTFSRVHFLLFEREYRTAPPQRERCFAAMNDDHTRR